MSDAPIAYYRLGDKSTAAKDELGAHDGTYRGAVTHRKGALAGGDDGAAVFDGASWVDIGDNFPFLAKAPFSIEAWIAIDSDPGDTQCVAAKNIDAVNSGSPTDGYAMYAYGTPLRIQISRDRSGNEEEIRGASVGLGSFVHVVATYDGSALSIYAGGALSGTSPSPAAITTVAKSFTIGASRGGTACFFRGAIDELAVYDKALSPDRIRAHHLAGIGQ